MDRCTRSGRLRKAVTQNELNETGLGGVFYVEYRTSMLMCLLFITLLFAPAEPLVFLLGSLACFVWYWVDKYLFVSYFRIPPRYSEEIPKVFGHAFRDAIVLHLIGAIFVFSDETIFPKSSNTVDGGGMVLYTAQDQYPPDTLTYRLIFDPNPNNDWMRPGLFRDEVVRNVGDILLSDVEFSNNNNNTDTTSLACDDFNRSKNHGQTLWSRMSSEHNSWNMYVCVFMLLWF